MKNSILLLFVVSIFMFNCSEEAVDNFDNQNLELNNSSRMADLTQKLSESQEFRNLFSTNPMLRNNENNGVMILQDPWGIFYVANAGDALYFMGGTNGSIDLLPNGRARFRVHDNNPSASVIDLATFSSTYSSDCIDGPLGAFNYNYISEYEELEIFPGFTVFMPTGENASAETANGHCNISNAQAIYNDDFTEIIGCTDATDYKIMTLGPTGISLN